MFTRFKRIFIGDRALYRRVLKVFIPSVIHMSVTNFVNLLDNLMVGMLGTAQMSGVAVTNQLMFVFNLTVFGVLSGAGIFGAQFFGAGDFKGVRNVFRIKLHMGVMVTAVAVTACLVFGDPLIGLYLKGEGQAGMAAQILREAKDYLSVMLFGLLPFVWSQAYAGSMREAGEMQVPMRAGVLAVLVNLVGNYLFIFGHAGFPAMGVKGAAIATVLSRYVELALLMYTAHRSEAFHFFHGIYRRLTVPMSLVRSVLKKGLPLMANELLWSMSMATLTQVYTLRGLDVLAATNISSNIVNMFNAVLISMGTSVAVLLGQQLGAGEIDQARKDVWKYIFVGFASCALIGLVLSVMAPLFPKLYNTEDAVRRLAASFIFSSALIMPFHSVINVSYFALRSGGKTLSTFFFDSVFNWLVPIPFTYCMVRLTAWPMETVFFLSLAVKFIQLFIGVIMLKRGKWAHNMVS